MNLRATKLVAAAILPLAVAGGSSVLAQATAAAAGKGAQTFTAHAHGTAFGFEVVTFLPTGPGPGLPTGCWMTGLHQALVSTTGNGVTHVIGNKTGDWFTTTYVGTAVVLPIVYTGTAPLRVAHTPTNPTTTTIVITTSATASASGRLRVWFGVEQNHTNLVIHATITFTGMEGTTPVGMSGHFDVTFNAQGVPTATPVSLTCT